MNQNTFIQSTSLPIYQERSYFYFFAKKGIDLVLSFFALVVLSPLFISICLAIRLSSTGPIFFWQDRLGKNGKIFKCLKFRTMVVGAEQSLPFLLSSHPLLNQEWASTQKLKHDPRIFPMGRFLRKTSLDELPQLWNILKGEMSFVGPRPYLVSQLEVMGLLAPKILSIRPGLTGLWQTSGRSRTTFQERVLLDYEYVTRQNFFFDLLLILKTFPVLISKDNAY